MARSVSSKRQMDELMARLSPTMRRGFTAALNEIRSGVIISAIVAALKRGDIDAAVRAVQLDTVAWAQFQDAMASVYNTSGQSVTAQLPQQSWSGTQMTVRFDGRATGAEAYLRTYSSQRIVQINLDQMAMIRAALTDGLQAGRNPTIVAVDIVGRYDRASGKRVGGMIGLTQRQGMAVSRARAELSSDNLSLRAQYLQRGLRDQRFDSLVRSSIDQKQPLSQDTIDNLTQRYSSRLLKLRADTIARTETLTALHSAQDEALDQAVDKGLVRQEDIRRVWRTALDDRVRDTHAAMEGQSVGQDEPFLSPSGAVLMYPGDPEAPPEEIINCRCIVETRIDFLANVRGR